MLTKSCLSALSLITLLAASCTMMPELRVFPAETGSMYFVPATEWKSAHNAAPGVWLDLTHHSGNELPPAINITFTGKRTMPPIPGAVMLNGDGVDYPLLIHDILFADTRKRELRVATHGDRDTFIEMIASEHIHLRMEADGANYTYTPHSSFYYITNDLLMMILF